MRIHTNLTELMIQDARRAAHVYFTDFSVHGSRTRRFGYNVLLEGSSTRRQNGGSEFAATWDEWGIFLQGIFAHDPIAHCWAYMGAEDFRWQTGGRFETLKWEDQCSNHNWTVGIPHEQHCKHGCGATRRWRPYSDPRLKPTGHGFSSSATVPPRGITAAEAYLAS